MRKNKGALISTILVGILVFIFLFSIFSSASVLKGQPFFTLTQESFGPEQTIEGNFNFSLQNEPGDRFVVGSVLSSVKEMKLLDYLRGAGAFFNCEPQNCNIVYSAFSPSAEKNFVLSEEEVYSGLNIMGRTSVTVKNLSFWLSGQSISEPTCGESPLKLDILDDDTIDWEYKVPSDWCTNMYGSECFSVGQAAENSIISSVPYCEKIELSKTGKVKLGAYLMLVSGDTADLEVSIYDGSVKKGACIITPWSYEYNLYECIIDTYEYPDFYISEEKDYFVCIKQTSGNGQITIKSEAQGSVCGFYGEPPKDAFTSDYALYVQLAGFAPFNEDVKFDEENFIGQDLKTYLQNYIDTKYNKNCSSENCVFPLKFISMTGQDLTLQDLYFEYDSSTGTAYSDKFYDLDVSWPMINMDEQVLAFSVLNLSAPEQPGQYSVTGRVSGAVGGLNFRVESVPTIQSVSPSIVIPGKETEFNVLAIAPTGRNIVDYTWNFGDGTGEQTTIQPNITHTYYQVGTYTLTVKARDNLDLIGSKSFIITSNITKELLNNTIILLKSRLENFNSDYNLLDYWYLDLLAFNVTEMNQTLLSLEQDLETAQQQDFINIKTSLDALNIPLSISDSLILRESSYYPNINRIKPEYIADISQEIYDSQLEVQYQNAIALWQQDNFNSKISGVVKSIVYEASAENVLTLMDLNIDPNTPLSNVYFVVQLPSGLSYNGIRVFSNADEEHDLNDAIGFSFYDLSSYETISIALPGKHDFSEVVFFVSPSLKELNVGQDSLPEESKSPPYLVAIFSIILILAIVFAVLWIIWHGKGQKKEKDLFKNPTDIYNILSFISSNQAAGLSKKGIVEKLKKVGWTKKQIDYAFKKSKEQKTIKSGFGRPMRPKRRF